MAKSRVKNKPFSNPSVSRHTLTSEDSGKNGTQTALGFQRFNWCRHTRGLEKPWLDHTMIRDSDTGKNACTPQL
ncbi:hypothetical protein CEXT_47921 [Caerostris extrusa]|uniref:Uncharacterized protein n=1 Tax=Caerostris extrusa TaxID=172846 RepID=A0AAV4XLP0_CAEEX|nr:hypothetical protein CEXT_47921 [Caerostris extrusa]